MREPHGVPGQRQEVTRPATATRTASVAPTDAELVHAVADGVTGALEELYRRHAAWLTLRLTRRCADATLVDEVLQDTFVAVWRSASRWSGEGEPAAWLWGIAVRRLVDAVRRRPRRTVSLDCYPADTADVLGDRVLSAEEQVLLGVQHGDVATALRRLSPELLAVVQATVVDGLSTREAAALLGIPAGTVKTRMMRARRALREELA